MNARGYTLLEIGVALLLIGLLVAVAVPSLNALTGAELKRATGMMQGLLRDTYSRAALSGNAHRVVIDIETTQYWVEAAVGNAVMPRKLVELTNDGGATLLIQDERIEDIDSGSDDEEDQAKRLLLGAPEWRVVPAPSAKELDDLMPQKLPSACSAGERDGCVRFKKVWVDHLADPARGGQVAITFFPGGYAQEAHITLTDEEEGDRVYTLEVMPLTAEVHVHRDEPDIPDGER